MRLLNRRQEQHIAQAVIADPEEHTVMGRDGGVRSIQAANVTLPVQELDAIWTPMHLERLARTYWKYLSRVTLGLIRVHYGEDERAVVLIRRPFVLLLADMDNLKLVNDTHGHTAGNAELLRFHPPEYEMSARRGIVRWNIIDGLLVSKRNEGFLEIDVRRVGCDDPGRGMIHVEVEIANFYPSIAHWLTRYVYTNTQSRIHVLVTHGFLRSLARLDLEESAVGRFRVAQAQVNGAPAPAPATTPPEDNTVGDTPWVVVGALVAGLALAVALAFRRSSDRG